MSRIYNNSLPGLTVSEPREAQILLLHHLRPEEFVFSQREALKALKYYMDSDVQDAVGIEFVLNRDRNLKTMSWLRINKESPFAQQVYSHFCSLIGRNNDGEMRDFTLQESDAVLAKITAALLLSPQDSVNR